MVDTGTQRGSAAGGSDDREEDRRTPVEPDPDERDEHAYEDTWYRWR